MRFFSIQTVLCGVLLFFAGSLSAADKAAPDFGFEAVSSKGALELWRVNKSYPFDAVEVVNGDPSHVRSGQHALKLVQNAPGKKGQLYSTVAVPVVTNEEYRVRLWVKGNGTVSMMAYLYAQPNGVEAFASSTGLPPVKGKSASLKTPTADQTAWRQEEFRFKTTNPAVKTARLVLEASGTVYVDDISFDPANEKKTAPKRDDVRPNLISIPSGGRQPNLDGRIEPGEYQTQFTGLLNNATQSLYPFANHCYMSRDAQRLYFGLQLQLPTGYSFKISPRPRDEAGMVADTDMLYLMIRPDHDPARKAFEGMYLAVSPQGTLYDAWETVDWLHSSCRRDASVNAGWQVKTTSADGIWTLEFSVPWKDLRIDPAAQPAFLMSLGMNLRKSAVVWQSHPNWFDHNQAFGVVRLSDSDVAIDAPGIGDLGRGKLAPLFHLENQGTKPVAYQLTYLVSTPRMVGGSIGTQVFDQSINVTQKEVVRDSGIYSWSPSGELAPGQSRDEKTDATLKTPKFYVLELEAKAAGHTVLYQKIPFHYSPPVTASLSPIPSKELVEADLSFHGATPAQRGKVRVAFKDAGGKVALSQEAAVTGEQMVLPISMAALPPGEYNVEFTLYGTDGGEAGTFSQPFKKWQTPQWLKHRAGIEALSPDWAPEPWTPVTVKGGRVSVWGRDFDFAKGSLLAGISSQGRPVLASGVQVKYLMGGAEHTLQFSDPRVTSVHKGQVQVTLEADSPQFHLTARQQIEFDGMDRFDVKIEPKQAGKIEKLWIDIPYQKMPYSSCSALQGTTGQFWQHGTVSDRLLDTPRAYQWIWLGDDQTGCIFFTENYKGWIVNSTKPRIKLRSEGKERTLQLLLVNEPSDVDSPLAVTFGLQPTPFKPPFKGWRNIRPQGLAMTPPPTNMVLVSASLWNSTDSKPSPRSWPMFKELVDYLHERKQLVFPYIGTFFISPYDNIDRKFPFDKTQSRVPKAFMYTSKAKATRQEAYFYFARDWNLVPTRVGEGTPETRMEARTSPSGSWIDFFVGGMAEMLKKSDVDGFFLDIANPMINFDESKGLTVVTKDGVREGTEELFAARDLYKRLYYVFEKYRGPHRHPYFIGHGFASAAPYSSFWDFNLNGEEIKSTHPFEFTQMSLQKNLEGTPMAITSKTPDSRSYDALSYRAMFGGQFGIPTIILPQYGYVPSLRLPEFSREMLSFTFLHNDLIWPAYIPSEPVYKFWSKVEVPFGMADTEFHPYWTNAVRSTPESVRVSYWKKPHQNAYLVAVANWSAQAASAQVNLPASFKSFTKCVDMESGDAISAEQGKFSTSIPAHNLRVFLFAQQ